MKRVNISTVHNSISFYNTCADKNCTSLLEIIWKLIGDDTSWRKAFQTFENHVAFIFMILPLLVWELPSHCTFCYFLLPVEYLYVFHTLPHYSKAHPLKSILQINRRWIYLYHVFLILLINDYYCIYIILSYNYVFISFK